MSSAKISMVVYVVLIFISAHCPIVSAHENKSPEKWWQHAVIYEIYPRSFADGKNSGTGNLNGIIEKLDYLEDLGIDAIWLTPCFPSPQVDFGYDVSDYCAIDPIYGTMNEFDTLVKEASKRKIKVIMDLVINHTSDKHQWFIESKASKSNPKRDWYIWKDGKKNGAEPPNNWLSLFGGSAWQRDERTKQFYYHFFYKEQPDLNWRNPEVKRAMHDVVRFWLDRGVYGFRLDAITTTFEDPGLRDNPVKPGVNAFGDPNMDYKYNYKLPEVHSVLKDLRKVLDSYRDERILIGETSVDSVAELSKMYGENGDEIHLPMNFFFAYVNKLSADEFRKQIDLADKNPANGWPVYLFSNHDQIRHYNRYGDGKNNDAIAKLTATLLLTLRGTPILYYGEEIGMENRDPKSIEEVRDPIGKTGWPREKGRDGERTPMQWTSEKNAGFSKVTPWLPVADNYKTHNVANELKDPYSILNHYKKLIALRKNHDAIKYGDYLAIDKNNHDVLSYLRKTDSSAVMVSLNMSENEKTINPDLKKHGINSNPGTVLHASYKDAPETVNSSLTLPPYGAILIEFQK